MNDPSDISWLRLLFAFSVVLALMAGLNIALRYISQRGLLFRPRAGQQRRLQILESLPLDTKRRAVLIRCDKREHLLLLGGQNDIVVESNLPPSENQPS